VLKIFKSFEEAETKLPNRKPIKVIVRDTPYCFVRIGDEIKAFSNLCPHQKASLSEGFVTQFNEIVCPLHEYRYNLNIGSESSSRCEGIVFIQITITPDGVFLEV